VRVRLARPMRRCCGVSGLPESTCRAPAHAADERSGGANLDKYLSAVAN